MSVRSPIGVLKTYEILQIPITATTVAETFAEMCGWRKDLTGRFVCIRDTASLVLAVEDPVLRAVHRAASIVTPDGMPLALIGRLRGFQVERCSGADLMEYALDNGRGVGMKHFFFGGKEDVAEILKSRAEGRFPGVEIVGTYCPPFRDMTANEIAELIDKVNLSMADCVWVGMSSPKQDLWMYQNHKNFTCTLVGVGAAFDYLSGSIKRAPKWMQVSGLEWLHRLLTEPRRLWRRYLIQVPKFFLMLAKESL